MRALIIVSTCMFLMNVVIASAQELSMPIEVRTLSEKKQNKCAEFIQKFGEQDLIDAQVARWILSNRAAFERGELVRYADKTAVRFNTKVGGKVSSETYAAEETHLFLDKLNAFAELNGWQIVITALTNNSHVWGDGHCVHMGGHAFDLRPLPGVLPTTWRERKSYSRKLNAQLIEWLQSQTEVKRIFFNDPVILKTLDAEKLSSYSGHDDHIHVQLNINVELQGLIELLLRKNQ